MPSLPGGKPNPSVQEAECSRAGCGRSRVCLIVAVQQRGGGTRRIICLVLASAILIGGLWLLYQQVVVWPIIKGHAIAMTGFLIAIGGGWLLGDYVIPFFRKR